MQINIYITSAYSIIHRTVLNSLPLSVHIKFGTSDINSVPRSVLILLVDIKNSFPKSI